MATFDSESKLWESFKFPYSFPSDLFLGEEILKKLKENPDKVAQIFVDDGSEVTFDDLRVSSVRIAQNLTKLGIKADDVVGVICKNSNEVTFLLTACVLIGAPINPLDDSFTKDDIKHLFGQTLPKLVVCDFGAFEKVQKALQELGNDADIFVTENEAVEGGKCFFDLLARTGTENDFIAPKFDKTSDEKIVAVMCSSGTTGLPKGVKVSHSTVLRWSLLKLKITNLNPNTRSITFSPIYWGTGFITNILHAFEPNDTRIFTSKPFSVKTLKNIVEKYQITNLTVPPMHLSAILSSNFKEINHKSLQQIISTGSILSEPLRRKFSETYPEKSLSVVYGMTELGVACSKPEEYKMPFSVGSFFLPNLEMKIVDDDGHRLGIGEIGELCGKSDLKFLGYYNNPEASANALDDEGFFKTGDLGYFDESNCLFIIDRKKEIYKYKGFHITPSEIESVIEEIEGVELVSVIGIPDEVVYSLSTAVIKKKPGFEGLTEEFIVKFVAEKLPVQKQLHGGVFFVDDFPKTPSGKIQKRILREIVTRQHEKKGSEKWIAEKFIENEPLR